MTPRERDEFERLGVVAEVERARSFIAQYTDHQEHYRREIEKNPHLLGRLDERLGEASR